MKKDVPIKKSIQLVSAALATGGLLAAGAGNASLGTGQNPFGMEKLSSGYMVAEGHKAAKEKPCDRRTSGEDSSMKKSDGENKCGEGSCGGTKTKKSSGENKCGEGSCGGTKTKKSSGENKGSEGSCG